MSFYHFVVCGIPIGGLDLALVLSYEYDHATKTLSAMERTKVRTLHNIPAESMKAFAKALDAYHERVRAVAKTEAALKTVRRKWDTISGLSAQGRSAGFKQDSSKILKGDFTVVATEPSDFKSDTDEDTV